MPHINRIRLVNVNFNDAKNMYDDFMMNFNGKSATYDLKNTGGKSLLLLMLLQTVLPNTYLKKEKPLKNIFLGGNTKRTSHCLVEWILDEGYEYKYMLTGFCARKRQNNDDTNDNNINGDNNKLEIDYYNYCYFYNKENSNDIKNIPLSKNDIDGKTYLSYDKLRQLLNNLKKDKYPVEIFDNRKDYMNHIEYYGLISAEWKLISQINVSENYIEKYFKENKTSRKIIENFLIKIIDNINIKNNDISEDILSNTLIDLKDNLMKFRKESDNKKEYLQVKELYKKLIQKNVNLNEKLSEMENLYKKAFEAYSFNLNERNNLNLKIKDENQKIDELNNKNNELSKSNEILKIDKLYNSIRRLENEREKLKIELDKTLVRKNDVTKKLELAKSQNEYIEYKESKLKADKIQIQIEKTYENDDDIKKDYGIYGYNYKLKLGEKIKETENELERYIKLRDEKNEEKKLAKEKENNVRDNCSKIKRDIENLEKEIEKFQKDINIITSEISNDGKVELLLNVEQSIISEKAKLESNNQNFLNNSEIVENLNNKNIHNSNEIEKIKIMKSIDAEKIGLAQEKINKYENNKKSIEKLEKTFKSDNIDTLQENLELLLQDIYKKKNLVQIDKQIIEKKLELIEKYNMIIPNEDIILLKERLEKKCSYVISGVEYLMDKSEEEKTDVLNDNSLFVYSIFVDNDSFYKIKNGQINIDTQNLVPIASIEVLRGRKKYTDDNFIFPIKKEVYQNLTNSNIEEYKAKLVKKIYSLSDEITKIKQKEDEIVEFRNEVREFLKEYSKEAVDNLYGNKNNLQKELEYKENQIKSLLNEIENNKEEILKLSNENNKLENESKLLKLLIDNLEDLHELQVKISGSRDLLIQKRNDCVVLEDDLAQKCNDYAIIEQDLEELREKVRTTGILKDKYSEEFKKLNSFNETEMLNKSFEEIKAYYEALNEKMADSQTEIEGFKEKYELYMRNMEKCKDNIEQNHLTIEYFSNQNSDFEKVPKIDIEQLEDDINKLSIYLDTQNSYITNKESEYNKLKGQIELSIENLKEKGTQYLEKSCIQDDFKIDEEIANNNEKFKLNKKEIKNLLSKISDIDKKIKDLNIECSGLEIFITDKNIKTIDIDVSLLLRNEIYSYNKIKKESAKLDKEVESYKDDFTNYIKYIKEHVNEFFIKQDIIDDVQEIKVPENVRECNIIGEGLNKILDIFDERINHIDMALANLEKYQENFITKCFEKAEMVVRDLVKLPGLSKIKIGGRDINIIKLDLFEYEREEKIRKIRDYIFNIIKEMEEKPEDMNKEQLNEKLSSTSLVSQIINMDKACVKLYKIEDVQSHSTYKRWEDDLGSDGQVNAIYFMFAVCIISYISMLTRKDASNKCKKVIIVDNPFGATSAVFLWNVMFEILKENNVQLIAPGHNINSQIVSMFEVNYVLKHEFYGDDKKSVVVDKEFRTEDNINNMSFEVIEGNQQSMFDSNLF